MVASLVIITFERLFRELCECFTRERPLPPDLDSPTFVMDFAWGDMRFEMAFACSLVARWIDGAIESSDMAVMACTVSNDNQPYFGRRWRQAEMQKITALGVDPAQAVHTTA